MVDFKCEKSEKCDKKKISSDIYDIIFGYDSKKKKLYPKKYKMLRFFADMPLSVNLFPWDSST